MRHITHREALASAKGVENLLPLIPHGSRLLLESDAVSTAYVWRKGSKKVDMNSAIRKQFQALTQKNIFVQAQHLAGELNGRADWLSRNSHCQNYRPHPRIFRAVCHHFQVSSPIAKASGGFKGWDDFLKKNQQRILKK